MTQKRNKAAALRDRVTLEDIATGGSVTIWHDQSRCLDSDSYDVEVKDKVGGLLIGTMAHASEMPELVGPVFAAHLASSVTRGTYVFRLDSIAVMALRGKLVERINSHDWS